MYFVLLNSKKSICIAGGCSILRSIYEVTGEVLRSYLDGDDDDGDAFQARLVEELQSGFGGNGWHHLRQGLLHCTDGESSREHRADVSPRLGRLA